MAIEFLPNGKYLLKRITIGQITIGTFDVVISIFTDVRIHKHRRFVLREAFAFTSLNQLEPIIRFADLLLALRFWFQIVWALDSSALIPQYGILPKQLKSIVLIGLFRMDCCCLRLWKLLQPICSRSLKVAKRSFSQSCSFAPFAQHKLSI